RGSCRFQLRVCSIGSAADGGLRRQIRLWHGGTDERNCPARRTERQARQLRDGHQCRVPVVSRRLDGWFLQVVVDRPAQSGSSSLHLVSSEPFDIDCADIAGLAKVTSSDPFIIGYVNFYFFAPLNITAIYTSQGCTFGSTVPSTNGVGQRPTTCLGPVSIE